MTLPFPRFARRLAKFAGAAGILMVLLAAAGALWVRGRLEASLPALEGEIAVADLSSPVTIARDALGVPVIRGASFEDVARAIGFVHGQERFFQMDLNRRRAAGELSALVGAGLVEVDRKARIHRFRDFARRRFDHLPAAEKEYLTAYSAGVNAGLSALREKPFEYLLLRRAPEPWTPDDTILVVLAMYFELQDDDGTIEASRSLMHETLPGPLYDFLMPEGSGWDAPLAGGSFEAPPVPGPEVVDLRSIPKDASLGRETMAGETMAGEAKAHDSPSPVGAPDLPDEEIAGSNNWAVSGAHTTHGGAIVANDMHLGHSVPNIWYRASFVWSDARGEHRVTGVTLPGAPVMIVGSNGRIAWGFTNSHGDWGDLVLIDRDPSDPDAYLTPGGPRRFDHHAETIEIAGGKAETLDVVSTIWGPLVAPAPDGRPRAYRWVAQEEEGVGTELSAMMSATGIEEAFEIAHRCGIPAQNLAVADASGRVGWTIIGRIPRRAGFDGRLPVSWADGTRAWRGWLDSGEYPAVLDPPSGRVWTANNRIGDGEILEKIGHGDFDVGSRAQQIRDDLLALDKAGENEMLAIQTDDRALFLTRWRDLILDVLAPEAVAADPRRAEMRKLVDGWGGRASIDSAGYRLVRAFRSFAVSTVFEPILAPCRKADPKFVYPFTPQYEAPLWALVSARPLHLVNPKYRSWEEELLAIADAVIAEIAKDGSGLASHTWGERNTARPRHPLSLALPVLGRWLDMPPKRLPGDTYMPRVQAPGFGASERMAVSPGREESGYFNMPCGQSGHPLSPHYRDGHDAWAEAKATPFLPGPAVQTLVLKPGA